MKANDVRLSLRRITALAAAIAAHISVLMVMLEPATPGTLVPRPARPESRVLEVRFISAAPPIRRPLARPSMPVPDARLTRTYASTAPRAGLRNKRPASPSPSPSPGPTVLSPPSTASDTAAAAAHADPASIPTSAADGGFQQRLRDAQQAGNIHGVPGSDTRHSPGVQLIDPMNRGIGSVMRTTQRLFGIPSSHCIDVEVWRSLSQDERNARHISPSQITAMDEKYSCNKPMGLSI